MGYNIRTPLLERNSSEPVMISNHAHFLCQRIESLTRIGAFLSGSGTLFGHSGECRESGAYAVPMAKPDYRPKVSISPRHQESSGDSRCRPAPSSSDHRRTARYGDESSGTLAYLSRTNGAEYLLILSLVISRQSNSCFSLFAPVFPVRMNESACFTAASENTATGCRTV